MSVTVERPIDEVFEFATNHVADWSLVVVEDEVITEAPDGEAGPTFRVVTEDRGKRMTFDGVVTVHDVPNRNCTKMTGTQFDIETDMRFEADGDSTRVT